MKVFNRTGLSAGMGPLRWWATGLVAGALVLAGVLVWQGAAPDEDATVVRVPSEYRFRCLACDHSWMADRAGVPAFFGGGLPTTLSPVTCPACKGRRAYMQAGCPFCGKHYVHKHLREPSPGKVKTDLCPHCGKDTLTWRK